MKALTLAILLPSLSLAFDECLTPTLDNGWIEAAPGSGPDSFVGRFRCREGFLLSGESRVKCRAGVWSQASLPVCTALMACPEEELPNIDNGYRRGVANLQNSVYRYKCYSGFRLMGARSVHCDGHSWVTNDLPICTRRGCDPADLFGSEIAQFEHGRVRSIYGGAAYRFKCNRGALMAGDRTVYCDGHKWNTTRPDCLVTPAAPVLSLDPRHSGSVQVGQRIDFRCSAQGGNPAPTLAFLINNQPAAAEKKSDGEIFLTIDVAEQYQGAQVVCTAINSVSRRPVYSKFHLIRIQFAPSEVYMTGPSLALPGDLLSFSCNSDEADPAPDLEMVAQDESGAVLPAAAQEPQPSMKTSRGWVSSTRMHFQTKPGVKRVEVQCTATNAMGEANTFVATQMQYLPDAVEVEGPSDVTTGEAAKLSCEIGAAFPKPQIFWTKIIGNTVSEVAEEETEIEVVQMPYGVSQVSRYTLRLDGDTGEQEVNLACKVLSPGTGESKTSPVHRLAVSYPSTTTSTTTTSTSSTTTSTEASTSTYTTPNITDDPEDENEDDKVSSESHEEIFEADNNSDSFVVPSNSSLLATSTDFENGEAGGFEDGAVSSDLETKEEPFGNEISSDEDLEEDARENSYEDSEESYGESDDSDGDEKGSDEDYEEFYDNEGKLFGSEQGDRYDEKESNSDAGHMRFSESGENEDESDSDAVEVKKKVFRPDPVAGKTFSDLNGLAADTVSDDEKNVRKEDSDPAKEDGFHGIKESSKSNFKNLESSMGGGLHPDNLNAVDPQEDIQSEKGLKEEKRVQLKWNSDSSLALEGNWAVDKKAKEVDNADEDMFLGRYREEPLENGEYLAAVPADTPTFSLNSADQRPLTAEFSPKTLHTSDAQVSNASNGLSLLLLVLASRIFA